jgi:hypothetical protein
LVRALDRHCMGNLQLMTLLKFCDRQDCTWERRIANVEIGAK